MHKKVEKLKRDPAVRAGMPTCDQVFTQNTLIGLFNSYVGFYRDVPARTYPTVTMVGSVRAGGYLGSCLVACGTIRLLQEDTGLEGKGGESVSVLGNKYCLARRYCR